MKTLLFNIVVGLTAAGTVEAREKYQSLRTNVAQNLPFYGFQDVDVDSLTTHQLLTINHLLHSSRSTNSVRAQINATLGNSVLTLFGIKR